MEIKRNSLKKNSRRNIEEILFYDFFKGKANIESIKSINEFIKDSLKDYIPFSNNKFMINDLILTNKDISLYSILLSKKIVKIKNFCHIININKKINMSKLAIEKFFIYYFAFLRNKNFDNIKEVKKYKNKYSLPHRFFDNLFYKIILVFLKNNLINIGFCEIFLKIQFLYILKHSKNFFTIFIDYLLNLCFDIELINIKNEEYNNFIDKIFSFIYSQLISDKDKNIFFYYSFVKNPKILKLLNFQSSEKLLIETKNKISLILKACIPYNLSFDHIRYLNLELKRLLLQEQSKNTDILFFNDLFKLFQETFILESNKNSEYNLNEGIIFLNSKDINTQIYFDDIPLKRNFGLFFSFYAFEVQKTQILFSLCDKNNIEIFSVLLEEDNLILKSDENKIIFNQKSKITKNKEYIVYIIGFSKGFFKPKIYLNTYLNNEILKNQNINLKIHDRENYRIFLGYKKQIIKNIEDKDLNNLNGILGTIIISNDKINENFIGYLQYILNNPNFNVYNIQEQYFGIKNSNVYNKISNNEDIIKFYSSIILNINYITVSNFFLKKKNKNMNDYIIFKNKNIIDWFLLNDGISFLTLVIEYFFNLIFNSNKFIHENEM